MYKIEAHLHTKPISACARFYPEEMIRFYKEAEYNTVFISDHFAEHHYSFFENLTWQEKNALLYDSYLRAKKTGEELGLHVLFSPELSLSGNHYLLYNASLDFLSSREAFFHLSFQELSDYAKSSGVTIIQAHPLRDGKCVPTPDIVDGFEVINTNPRHENFDERAIELAREHSLLMSAGSDAHRTEDVGRAAVLSPYDITTTDEYLDLLRSGEARLVRNGEIIL